MREKLLADLEAVKDQKREAIKLYYEACGTIEYINHLLEKDAIPIQKFAEMVGGKGAKCTLASLSETPTSK